MVRLVIGIVIVGLLVQTGASEECSLGKDGNTIDFGKCKNGKGKLKVQGSDLNFKLHSNENAPDGTKKINVTIGSCAFTCKFIGETNEKPNLLFSDLGRIFHFPVPVKLSADGYTVGEGSNAVHLPATCVYNPSQTGMVVEFDFTLKEKIPGLKLTFENAHAFNVTDEDPDWSVKSWRLWSTIGGGIVGVVIVGGCIGLAFWWFYLK
ncbi:hypothetical protein M3Y94_01277100 [Aphelenchoides besseyi]|nr:hypothetical protein M3Y94_01277100 [Aphelenchoides besseyi]KAI6222698.1 hypothetical protein M3Y95_00921200 [Aphelenchoides besseyi]